MKTILSILLLTSSLCFSQPGFIEIEVRDSIQLKPETFEYHISIDDSMVMEFNADVPYNPKVAKTKRKEKLSELQAFLTNKGYSFSSLNDLSYEVNNSSYLSRNDAIVITLNKSDDLQKISEDLKELDFVNGKIGKIYYEDEEKSEERLFKKILEKTNKKAQMIAKLSGLKLGKLVDFKEVKEVDNISYSMLDIFMVSQQGKPWNRIKNNLYGQKTEAIVVKFLAE
ncbi:hypothetical protein UMM65_06320 [Aureibaculum sp. 2210JD6-5]|uniref:hypothetical protein n=1 Tax=Aureibaculum sp. 2210JD6-5 TaxID=3103957 RepID=UPI002AAD7097|nr:hypothetical protein [Aureibaculum sp. 2210JD6-5]MDY7394849.1 hypothetical protein [Aureibaculum sp. 2210JD6-5]